MWHAENPQLATTGRTGDIAVLTDRHAICVVLNVSRVLQRVECVLRQALLGRSTRDYIAGRLLAFRV